jgi:hypothetical protein
MLQAWLSIGYIDLLAILVLALILWLWGSPDPNVPREQRQAPPGR